MQIFVKTLDGTKTITLEVDPSDTIFNVKFMVMLSTNLPPDKQRIMLNTKELADDSTLAEYHIAEWETLHLVPRHVG